MKNIKRRIKLVIASIVYYCGLLALVDMIKRRLVVNGDACVLMYHRVVDNPQTDHDHTELGLIVSSSTLEKQIAYLARKYNLITVSELATALMEGRQLPPRSVAITFDDGWRDNYTHAYPILKKYNAPATIFLTTDFIGSGDVMWFHRVGLILGSNRLTAPQIIEVIKRVVDKTSVAPPDWLEDVVRRTEIVSDLSLFLERLKKIDLALMQEIIDEMMEEAGLSLDDWKDNRWIMTWEDARQVDSQIVQFGSHGKTHRIMTRLKPDDLATELSESKAVIEDRLGRPVDLLAYPNGDYSPAIIEAAKEMGYLAAFATTGMDQKDSQPDLFAIRRVGVHEGSSSSASGRFSRVLFAFSLSNWRSFPQGSL